MSFLPPHRRDELRRLAMRSHQVVVWSAVTGAITGLLVAVFDWLVVDVLFDHVRELDLWLVAVMPAVGLLTAFAIRRHLGGGIGPATADEYLHAFHDGHHALPARSLGARVLAAIATLGAGAPMGLEGPSLYIGASVGSNLQRRLPGVFRGADRRTLLVAGAGAGVAAIFKAPATGAVFSMEVPYQDDLARRMLLPALISSASGYLAFVAVHGTDPLFPITGDATFSFRDLAGAVGVGLLAGIGARGFAWMLRRAKGVAAGPHRLAATVISGVVLAATFALGRVLTGESLLVGSGYAVVHWAAEPDHSIWLLLAVLGLRCAATSVTVAGGGVGGLFIPLVVAGALSGSVIAEAVAHSDRELFIVIGVAAFLGAGYRVPLAAVMFVAETTGRPAFVVPGLLAAVAAELMMGHSSVTAYQRSPEDTPMTEDSP